MTLSNLINRRHPTGTKFASIALVSAMVGQLFLGAFALAKNPSADLDQCANGTSGSPVTCATTGWQNGNLNANNSHYAEGDSAAYRVVLSDLTAANVYSLVIEYDVKNGGKHAIDFLTSFDRTESAANPCSGVSGCSLSGTVSVPAPSSAGSPVSGQPTTAFNALPSVERAISLYNATSGSVSYVTQGDLTASQSATQVKIQFTASSATAVIAWGGHIASPLDWGSGNSASGISGSPYHMRLVSLTDANLGNQDRSLSADAVAAAPQPGTLTVIKHVVNDDDGTAIAADFTMNVSGTGVSTSSFPGSETGTSVTLDAGNYSVTEGSADGYTASYSADCSGTISAGEAKTCTITNDDEAAAPTVGTVTVTKVVVNDDGGTAVIADFPLFVGETEVVSGAANDFAAGDYVISETDADGYAGTFSGDCDADGNLTVAAGQSYSCTITNDDIAPQLTVTKVVVNDDGGEAQVSDFPLYVGETQVTSGEQNAFDAGDYVVSETGADGYAGTFSGDCDADGNVTLALGDVKSCTLTNNDIAPEPTTGLITVVKIVDGGDAVVSDFNLYVGETQVTSGESNEFDTGSYVISEDNLPNYSAAFSGDCDADGLLTLGADEDLTCTITNTYTPPAPTVGTVTVTKVVVGGDAVVSDFNLYVGDTQVTSGESNEFEPGNYWVHEDNLPNYSAEFSGDCDVEGDLTVEAGETYECTITNTYSEPEPETGSLTVVKVVINDNGGEMQVSDFPLFVGQQQVTSGESNSFSPGSYAVSETGAAGYVASFSGDCDASGIVSLESGDQKTCTITNDDVAPPSGGGGGSPVGLLIVVTNVVNDDGGIALPSHFLMTVTSGSPSSFAGMGTPGMSLATSPGAFTVNGSDDPGYSKSLSANCSGNLVAGQTLTCVVTYDDIATGGPSEPPAPPAPPEEPQPQVLGATDEDPTPVPQVLGATDEELPVTGLPSWTLMTLLAAAAPFIRRKRA